MLKINREILLFEILISELSLTSHLLYLIWWIPFVFFPYWHCFKIFLKTTQGTSISSSSLNIFQGTRSFFLAVFHHHAFIEWNTEIKAEWEIVDSQNSWHRFPNFQKNSYQYSAQMWAFIILADYPNSGFINHTQGQSYTNF